MGNVKDVSFGEKTRKRRLGDLLERGQLGRSKVTEANKDAAPYIDRRR